MAPASIARTSARPRVPHIEGRSTLTESPLLIRLINRSSDRSIILSLGFDLLSLIYEVSSFAPPIFLVVASVIIAE
jgi:hypothetical protein